MSFIDRRASIGRSMADCNDLPPTKALVENALRATVKQTWRALVCAGLQAEDVPSGGV